MTRRQTAAPRKGDVRRDAILDAAEQLLTAIGYDRITMADIASGAGITRSALYFYFGSKQDVITALFARCVAVLHEKSQLAVRDADRGPAAIDGALQRTEALWREHGVVMRTAIDLATTVDELDTLWKDTADIFIDAIRTILEKMGVPAGTDADESVPMATTLCWMIERNFSQASRESAAELARVSTTCSTIWRRAARAD